MPEVEGFLPHLPSPLGLPIGLTHLHGSGCPVCSTELCQQIHPSQPFLSTHVEGDRGGARDSGFPRGQREETPAFLQAGRKRGMEVEFSYQDRKSLYVSLMEGTLWDGPHACLPVA